MAVIYLVNGHECLFKSCDIHLIFLIHFYRLIVSLQDSSTSTLQKSFLVPYDGCPLPDPPSDLLLLPASHGEVESVPELEVLGYIDDDIAGGVDDQHEVVPPGEVICPARPV